MAVYKEDFALAEEPAPRNPFGVEKEELDSINQKKDMRKIKKLGGLDQLAYLLVSNTKKGLNPKLKGEQSIASHALWYGENREPQKPRASFLMLMLIALKDPIMLLLIFAALVSTILGVAIKSEREKNVWVEGLSIWILILIVAAIGAANDHHKDTQLLKLAAARDRISIKVIRGGKQTLVTNHDLVVGDLVLLEMGDRLVADGILIASDGLILDESSLTGRLDRIKKSKDANPWLRSGTKVLEGSGSALIIAVGKSTEMSWSIEEEELPEEENSFTPLQHKLADLAMTIGKEINEDGPIQFFLYCLTILVVAVPEGLPLVVTISLAYSIKKMMQDKNFVRQLSSSEIMGGASTICTNKTGTLTEDGNVVAEAWCAGMSFDHSPTAGELPPELLNELRINIAMNSQAYLVEDPSGSIEYVGSQCECALLMMLKSWGFDYKQAREDFSADLVKTYVFNSARKMSSALVRFPDRMRLYNKGAPEWVLRRSKCVYTKDGNLVTMTDDIKQGMLQVVTDMGTRGLRCICLAYTDYPLDDPHCPAGFFDDASNVNNNLNCMCIVGIKDEKAGIVVRMVTGDNLHTATQVAKQLGIISEPEHLSLEGSVLNTLEPYELEDVLPRLRVLARTSPDDKVNFVQMLQKRGETVAVTGDGTEVTKEAADILILDDSFTSIIKSVLWGRAVYTNVQKFLQFQLSVNVSSLCIAFIGALAGTHRPLNVLQLLWINLIMDTLAALALATERPSKDLLEKPPHGYKDAIITPCMWKHIIIQSVFFVTIMLVCLFGLPTLESFSSVFFVTIMLVCLFGLPNLESFSITDEGDFYATQCIQNLVAEYGYSVNASTGGADWMCSLMNNCGFPFGSEATMDACPLTSEWLPFPVPDDDVNAICLNKSPDQEGVKCQGYSNFDQAKGYIEQQYKEQYDEDWSHPLTILFTVFVFMLIFHEINCRRIQDEYNIFQGIFSNLFFPLIITLVIGIQIVITTRLTWQEWIVCAAVGTGSLFISFVTRFLSRNINWSALKLWSPRSSDTVHPAKPWIRQYDVESTTGLMEDNTNSQNEKPEVKKMRAAPGSTRLAGLQVFKDMKLVFRKKNKTSSSPDMAAGAPGNVLPGGVVPVDSGPSDEDDQVQDIRGSPLLSDDHASVSVDSSPRDTPGTVGGMGVDGSDMNRSEPSSNNIRRPVALGPGTSQKWE
eukprot:gene32522-17235_t